MNPHLKTIMNDERRGAETRALALHHYHARLWLIAAQECCNQMRFFSALPQTNQAKAVA